MPTAERTISSPPAITTATARSTAKFPTPTRARSSALRFAGAVPRWIGRIGHRDSAAGISTRV